MADEDETPELHPAVQLVLARMDSHPEEFQQDRFGSNSKWRVTLEEIRHWATPEEKRVLKATERRINMERIHKDVMGKLLGADEVEQGSIAKMTMKQQMANAQRNYLQQQQAYNSVSSLQQQMYGAGSALLGNTMGAGNVAPASNLVVKGSNGEEAMRVEPDGTLRLGGAHGESLTARMLREIKELIDGKDD